MKRIILCFLAAIFCGLSFTLAIAQPTIEWQASPNAGWVYSCSSLVQTTDGGYATGQTYQDSSIDVLITRLKPDGSTLWQKKFGGKGDDVVYSIIQTHDGGFLFGGKTNSIFSEGVFHYGKNDAWLVKLDSNGVMEWQQCYGGSEVEWARCVIQTFDNNYVFVGAVFSNDGDAIGNHSNPQDPYHGPTQDAWVVKVDSRGKLLWEKCFGGGLRDDANSIIQTPDGSLVFAGSTESTDGDVIGNSKDYFDMWVVKCKDTSIIWQKCISYRYVQEASSLCRIKDGGFVITGTIDYNDTIAANSIYRKSDLLTVKLDSAGGFIWQRCMGGSNSDGSSSVAATSDGGSIVLGNTTSTDDDLELIRTGGSLGFYDIWIIKFNSDGKTEWSQIYGGSYDELGCSIIQTLDGGFALAATTESKDGDVKSNNNVSKIENSWIVKLRNTPSEVSPEKMTSNIISISPNPTTNELMIRYNSANQLFTKLEVYNLLGNRVLNLTDNNNSIGEGQIKIDVSKLPEGMYMLKLESGAQIATGKFTIVR